MDASKQTLHPMPDEHDDDDHDVISVVASTTTLAPGSPQTELPAQPSDHIDRPVNEKPNPVTATASSASTTAAATPSVTEASNSTSGGVAEESSSSDTFLPHYFPTFGVSKKTQIWIYGSALIIIAFCTALGAYFIVQRRRRARVSRDDYEFEMLDDDEAKGENGALTGRRTKRRAGELYDAFAGESDEEIFSDAEGEYKDEKVGDKSRSASSDRDEREK